MRYLTILAKNIRKIPALFERGKTIIAKENNVIIEEFMYSKNMTTDVLEISKINKNTEVIAQKRAKLKELLLNGQKPPVSRLVQDSQMEEVHSLLSREGDYLQRLLEIESEANIQDIKLILSTMSGAKFNPYTGERITNSTKAMLDEIKKLIDKRHIPTIKKAISEEMAILEDNPINEVVMRMVENLDSQKSERFEVYSMLLMALKSNRNLTSTNIESSAGSYSKRFLEYIESQQKTHPLNIFIKDTTVKYKDRMQDFEIAKRVESMVEFFKESKKLPESKKVCDALYSRYLEIIVKQYSPKYAKELINRCEQINREFGVKVILPKDTSEAGVALKLIYQELSNFKMYSKGKAKMPPVLDFLRTKTEYIDKTSAYGKNASAGFCESMSSGAVSLDGMTISQIKHAIRHEFVHTNDLKLLDSFPEGFGKKYYNEFKNAGIPINHIDYAYNNPKEFIAVASEGDMSKYSEEFKRTLVEFGMPEWMLNMQNPSKWTNTVSKCTTRKIPM